MDADVSTATTRKPAKEEKDRISRALGYVPSLLGHRTRVLRLILFGLRVVFYVLDRFWL